MIPGTVKSIVYAGRNGPGDRQLWKHDFGPGVRMKTNRDGSVTLKGPRRIHADDRSKHFSRYLENPRMRRNPEGGGAGFLGGLILGTILSLALGQLIGARLGAIGDGTMAQYWINDTTCQYVAYPTGPGPCPGAGFRVATALEIFVSTDPATTATGV